MRIVNLLVAVVSFFARGNGAKKTAFSGLGQTDRMQMIAGSFSFHCELNAIIAIAKLEAEPAAELAQLKVAVCCVVLE